MHGCRTSTMAPRTTTTRTTRTVLAPSACQAANRPADFSFGELRQAYLDCRKNKGNKPTAIAFAEHLEQSLLSLYTDLVTGSYRPGRSICFVVTRPKPREVWAADFRDRVVHHLLYNRIAPRFLASFIDDSCACIPGRGTLYAVRRLESKNHSTSENWTKPVWYLKCDLANFFVSIDKDVLWQPSFSPTSTWTCWTSKTSTGTAPDKTTAMSMTSCCCTSPPNG